MSEQPNWGTSTTRSDYSPTQYYCRSTNKHDHKETIRAYPRGTETMPQYVGAPPHIVGAVNEAIAHPYTPYRSQHDFVRDAVVHRLAQLGEFLTDFDPSANLNLEVVKQGIIRRQLEREEWTDTIATMDAEIETYYADRNPEGIADVLADAETLAVPGHYRREWDSMIDRWNSRLGELAAK